MVGALAARGFSTRAPAIASRTSRVTRAGLIRGRSRAQIGVFAIRVCTQSFLPYVWAKCGIHPPGQHGRTHPQTLRVAVAP